mgnify:CR=1 FL=1
MSEQEIEERRARFKVDVQRLAASSVVDRHVIFGDCYILDKDSYFTLKEQIADHFKIHPPQVVMVGSGKLGFSIAPRKRYRSFGETSDLDIAIVAPSLFDRIWEEVFKARGTLGYWPGESDFSVYLMQGWIRPDKLPSARKFEIAMDWWRFFDALAASGEFGPFKIRGGLYRDWTFLKGYQNRAVLWCKADLEPVVPVAEAGAEMQESDAPPVNAVAGLEAVVATAETAAEIQETGAVAPGTTVPDLEPVEARPERHEIDAGPRTSIDENDRNESKA